MFSTLQPSASFKQKKIQTAIPHNRRHLYIQNQQTRPFTVNYEYFQTSLNNSKKLRSFKTIDIAEIELKRQFQKQIKQNPYLKQKIKQITIKNQKNIYFGRSYSRNQQIQHYTQDPQSFYQNYSTVHFNDTINTNINTINTNINTINNHRNNNINTINSNKNTSNVNNINYITQANSYINSPISIKQMRISRILNNQSHKPIIVQKVIDEAIISNTKQKINRLIEMKKQKQFKFNLLNKNIKIKCSDNNNPHLRRRSLFYQNQHPLIQNQQWDQQWRQQLTKQSNRYRNRLLNLHKKSVDRKIPGNIQSLQSQ